MKTSQKVKGLEYFGVSSLLVSEDLGKGFSFPYEDHGEDQTSLVKV